MFSRFRSRRIEQDIPVWRYRYYGNFSNISPLPWMGAYHSSKHEFKSNCFVASLLGTRLTIFIITI